MAIKGFAGTDKDQNCQQAAILGPTEMTQIEQLHLRLAEVTAERDVLRAELAAAKEEPVKQWRCYHCDQVFTDPILAAAHFGDDRKTPKPAACEGLLNAYAETFERYGINRNHHNAASVKQLANKFEREADGLRAERDALAADNARLRKALEAAFDGAARQLAEPRNHDNDQYALTAIATTCELALAATPAQSLAAHDTAVKVAVLREVVEELRDMARDRDDSSYDIAAYTVEQKADRIEKEAANG